MIALDDARAVGDPEADAVVAAFATDHPGVAVRDLVGAMVAEVRRGGDDQHPAVRAYLLEGPELPPWVDPTRIAAGQAFFREHGLLIGATLFCASLPEAYAAADGVEVLAITAELQRNPRRRIAETGQLLVQVMALDDHQRSDPLASLRPGGDAYRSVRGVRLLHAGVRAAVLAERSDDWVARHGVPVNQQDLVGTLLTFTSVVYRALDRFGIAFGDADAEGHLHLWCTVGWLLGIDESLLPWSRAEADATAALLRQRLHRRSDAGRALTAALLEELEATLPRAARLVPRTLVRHLVGDGCADLIGVPPAARWRRILGPMSELDELGGTRGPGAAASRVLSRTLSRSLFAEYIDRGTRGERPPFAIPADLATSWRVAPRRRRRPVRDSRHP